MKLLLITLVSTLGYSGAFAQQTINASITHDGMQRDYILYVPAIYDGTTNVPLLFNFHGYTSNAQQQMFYGDFRPISDTANFIVAHPQGTLDNTGNTHFNVGWGGSTVDDVSFTSALLDTLISQYAIDNERVYSTGMSNGGYMSFRLACELSDRIAAVASVTGAMSPTTLNSCSPTHMTPIMQIHGTADGTVPYNGAAWSSSVADILDYWKTYNALNPAPFIESMPDIDGTDGSTVEREAYLDNNGCMIVTHFKIANGGHTWPGAPFDIGGTNYDIDASTEVWGFLSQFNINGVIGNCQSAGNNELDLDVYSIYPNPAKDIITVEGLNTEAQHVQLITLAGKVLLEVELDATNNTLNLSKIPAGNYLLTIGNTTISLSKLD
jgi:polyhydroxybutyrate depolymerase